MRLPGRAGRYELLELIGAGGMGEVYRGRDPELGREVAVKILPEALAGDPQLVARLRREALALAAVEHPNIVTVHAVEELEAAGSLCVIMELVDGRPLSAFMEPDGLQLDRFLALAVPLAEALAAAHERRIAHRDLKPANVMVTDRGAVKVLDFGLAREIPGSGGAVDSTLSAATELTAQGTLLGTIGYMAPEQVRGERSDLRADVFSLGVLCHELLTGARLFERATTAEAIGAVLHEDPPDLAEVRPDLPAELARIVRRCLARDPGRRIQTGIDVRNALEELRGELGRRGPTAVHVASGGGRLVPCGLHLTVEHLRGLSRPEPRLLGRTMLATDNEVSSDVLAIYLHGTGLDHRQFAHLQLQAEHRAVAVTLLGFEPEARWRPALTVDDHLRLLREFVLAQVRRLRPAKLLLVGFSSGADLWLRLLAEPPAPGLEPFAVLALGPNVALATCFVTGLYADLTERNPDGLLQTLKVLGGQAESLDLWLTLHEYLVQAFRKFGEGVTPLRVFSAGITAPFEAGGDPFPAWYRAAVERARVVRCVFATPESEEAERLLARHLADDVLGPRFAPDTFRIEPVHHLRLAETERVLRLVDEAIAADAG